MVMAVVTVMTALLVDFSFETKVNKIRNENMQDRFQARLNAQAGLTLGLARLRLYQEVFNFIQNNESLKKNVKQEMLNPIWNVPFIFPLPAPKEMDILQKTALEEFTKETIIEGEMRILIENASNKINLNLLRLSQEKLKSTTTSEGAESDPTEENTLQIEPLLIRRFTDIIEKKREQDDEEFELEYPDLNPKKLVSSLKYYVSDPETFQDEFTNEFQLEYESRGVSPKFAPLSSLSEISLISGWDEKLQELLLGNDYTVHGALMIDLNKISRNILKMIFPDILDDQIKEFFEYRDDPEEPHYFNTVKEFEDYIVGQAKIASKEDFDKRIEELQKAGINFGPVNTLFKVISTGSKNESTYTLEAFILIPAKPSTKKDNAKKKSKKEEEKKEVDEWGNEIEEEPEEDSPKDSPKESEKEPPLQLLRPRTLEIKVS